MRQIGTMNPQPSRDPICYWFLLDSNLRICYTSPSFNNAVNQYQDIIGKSFLDYLHTPSGDILAIRLHDCLADDTDQAAVLTINYASVSIIRHHLNTGQFIEDPPNYSFIQYQLVVNRAAGFLLVFLHVKADFLRDCDFHLYEALKPGDLSSVVHYLPPLNPSPPYHVFQILLNDDRRSIIFSTTTTIAGRLTVVPAHLAASTQSLKGIANNQCQTSCTNRTKGFFFTTSLEGELLQVDCSYLKHGNALLVMYRLVPTTVSAELAQPTASPDVQRYNHQPITPIQYHPHNPGGYRRPSGASDGYSQTSPIQHQQPVISPAGSHHPYSSPYSPGVSPMGRMSPYETSYPPQSPDGSSRLSPHSPRSIRHAQGGMPIRRHSLAGHSSAPVMGYGNMSPRMGSLDEHRAVNNNTDGQLLAQTHSPTESTFIMEPGHGSSSSYSEPADLAGNALRGRPAKEPPKGVTCCRSCHTTSTPEWRKGPTGIKDMCNACGLRWNRRLKKMKGDGPSGGDNMLESLNLTVPEAEAMLEPQRSGGGSKKGHRKKSTESRTPALTTKPAKRRHSDVGSPLSGRSEHVPPSPDFLSLQQRSHPHNPHYHHHQQQNHNIAGGSSQPRLSPLFDGPASFPPQTPLGIHTSAQNGGFPPPSHPPPPAAHHNGHHLKDPSTPESSHFYNSTATSSNGGGGAGGGLGVPLTPQEHKPFIGHYDSSRPMSDHGHGQHHRGPVTVPPPQGDHSQLPMPGVHYQAYPDHHNHHPDVYDHTKHHSRGPE